MSLNALSSQKSLLETDSQRMNLLVTIKEGNLLVTIKEGWAEEIVREFGMDVYTLLFLKWMTNKDLRTAQELGSIFCNNLNWERI